MGGKQTSHRHLNERLVFSVSGETLDGSYWR
jgi:hypothetical protein